MLGVATVLHWDRFSHHLFAFWLWTFLYFTLPFVLPIVWWRANRTASTTLVSEIKVELPEPLHFTLAAVLLPGLVVAALLFVTPNLMIDVWPWTVTPLTARVVSAQFALYGVLGLQFVLDPDWATMRRVLRWQLLTPLLYPIAIAFSWNDLLLDRPLTWLYLVNGSIVFVAGVPVLYWYMETRWRRAHRLLTPSKQTQRAPLRPYVLVVPRLARWMDYPLAPLPDGQPGTELPTSARAIAPYECKKTGPAHPSRGACRPPTVKRVAGVWRR